MGGFLFIILMPGKILSITMSILLLCWQKTSSSYAIMQLLLLLLYLKKSFSSHRRHRRNRGGTVKIWLPIIFSFFFCNRLEIWPDDKWFWYYYYYFYYYIIVILFQSWICSLIILIDLLYGTLCIHSSTKKWLVVGSKNRRILRILNFESCKAKQSWSRVCRWKCDVLSNLMTNMPLTHCGS